MSGRGDNNKRGTSGQGSSNQSGQGLNQTKERGKANHGEKTGGKPSVREEKSKDRSSNRDEGVKKEI